MLFVKSGIMGAASLISLSAAAASEPEELASAGLLELAETPMTASELGEARGGFSFGGLTFNFSINVPPPSFDPLPDGPFGPSGSPFGANGNPADNKPPVNGADIAAAAQEAAQQGIAAGGAQQQPQAPAANNAPAPQQPQQVAQNTPAPIAHNPSAAPTVTQNIPAPPTPAPQPAASAADPVPLLHTDPVANQVAQAPVNTDPAGAATDNTAATATMGTQTQSGEAQPSDMLLASNDAGSTQSPAPAPAAVSTVAQATGGSQQQQQQGAASSDAQTGGSGNSSSASNNGNGYPVTLREVQEQPEIIRQVGPNGITTIINNSLNNVRITERANMNVVVQGYDFVMGMRRVNNITSQVVTQGIFLPGLN